MSDSTTNTVSQAIPPEEEELFKEFQSYVRSIYTAASDGAIQTLTDATEELRRQVNRLDETVSQSREGYLDMFLPAVERFEASANDAMVRLATKQDEVARIHWEKTAELVRQQSQHHWEKTSELVIQQSQEDQTQLLHQQELFEKRLNKRIHRIALVIVGLSVFLAIAIAGVLYLAFQPK